MLSKFYKVLYLVLILNFSVATNSEIKEIITIEEYSKQFLNENFILEDMKKEETTSSNERNIDVDEEEVSEEKYKDEMAKIEEVQGAAKDNLKEIGTVESSKNEVEKKETEKKEIKDLEQTASNKNTNSGKVAWNLSNNFRAAIIGDLNGEVYYSKNADKIYPLASVTKMMTLMVTFDEINAKRVSLKDKVKITSDVANHGGSGIPLKPGQVFVLEDLIKASAVYSANNATYAIAKHVGKGSIPKFIGMMNKKLEKLGLQKDIKYYTPAGLPTRMTKQPMDAGTARAIYKLSIEALKYKKYMEIAGIKNTKIHSGQISIRNRNHLLGKEGVYGIKTGYHKEAKYNIAVASKIDGVDVVIVVMGGETYSSRDKVVLDLIKSFKENYNMESILDKTKAIGKVKIAGTDIEVPVVPDKNYKKALTKSQEYKVIVKQRENIKLNVFKGEKLGEYQVYIDGKMVTRGKALAQRAVTK